MARRTALLLLALGTFAGGLAESRVDDAQNLVQKALEVRDVDQALDVRPAVEKQTPEERKQEPITRRNLKELISTVLKMKGVPPMVISVMEEQIVPKIMESRRRGSSMERRLIDGVLDMDILGTAKADLTTKLDRLSGAVGHAGLDEAASGLHNLSIILPPVLSLKPQLANATAALADEFKRQLASALQDFAKDLEPATAEFSRQATDATAQYLSEVWPLVEKLGGPEGPITGAIKTSVAELQRQWHTGQEFKNVRSALREIFGNKLQDVWKDLYDEESV